MKIALAAVGFCNNDISYNKNKILSILKQYSAEADLVVFGEAFLQGFYAVTFHEEQDSRIAVSLDSAIIREIQYAAKTYQTAVSFGMIEKNGSDFYSDQLTIGPDGEILDLFRRVSPGWKESFADNHYREGNGFHTFFFKDKRIAVGLCGDLWFDENVEQVKDLNADLVLWPVYTDFIPEEWNTTIKHEYAEQASRFCHDVVYVNSVCTDKDDPDIARGGCAFFQNGTIRQEAPSGKEEILLVTL